MQNNTLSRPGLSLSGTALKRIACLSMLLDHIGASLLENGLFKQESFWPGGVQLDDVLRLAGRLAFPIFAFQIAEGCIRTHDRRRYALRLLLFAVLTEVPFDLAFSGRPLDPSYQNVLWTLLAGALVCWAADWAQRTPAALHLLAATAAFAGAFWLLEVCHTDYGGWGMALILLFHLSRGNRLIQLAGLAVFCVASVGGVSIELYALVSLAFIWLYDGRRGYCSRPIQWLCYAFYPVHLLLLWLSARTVGGIWYLT